jgi:hypothetical protein
MKFLMALVIAAFFAATTRGNHSTLLEGPAGFHRYDTLSAAPTVVDSVSALARRLVQADLQPVRRKHDLDHTCRAALEAYGIRPFADWDEPFNGGCIRDSTQPNQRLVVAGHGPAGGYFVLVSGGFVSQLGILLFGVHDKQISLVAWLPVEPGVSAADDKFSRSMYEFDQASLSGPATAADIAHSAEQLQRCVFDFLATTPSPRVVLVRE